MKRFLLLAFCCLLSFAALAQKNPKNKTPLFLPETFAQQLLQTLNDASSKDDVQALNAQSVDNIARHFAALSADDQQRLTDVYNTLVRQKIRPLPDLRNITDLLSATFQASTPANISGTIAALAVLQDDGKRVKDALAWAEFAKDLALERTLYASRASSWQAQKGAPYSIVATHASIRIVFDSPIELYYGSGADNGTIFGTKGYFDYLDATWVGSGGRVGWERTGIPASKCFAVLNSYKAAVKFPKFSADSALFTNTNYFAKPIYGRLSDALSVPTAPDKYLYPKFESYQSDFVMKDVLPGVDYRGSFMMNGAKFVTSDEQHPATMVFYRDGKEFVNVQSYRFTITPSRLSSEHAAVKIFVDGDSICNEGVMVRYNAPDKKLVLLNDAKRNYFSPYFDSYHNLDIYSESIIWDIPNDRLSFSSIGGQSGDHSASTFESSNYYSYRKYKEIAGIDDVSPVTRVYNFIKKRDLQRSFFVSELASGLHLDIMQAKLLIHGLAHSGLVYFDESENRVTVKDKLIDYVKAYNKSPKTDYDAIVFLSDTKGANASLSLDDNDLMISGIQKFVVSDSQQVVIFPTGGNVVVHRNRNLSFSGNINAGRFIMHVSDAQFDYDKFLLELPHIDSIHFYVSAFDDHNRSHIVYTPLYNLVGSIQIDAPNNHSGLRDTKDYPVFTSREDGFVYYDRPFIRKGAYLRDKFYYKLSPFVIKNLLKFETDSLKFNGTLVSAGIFPDIVEQLVVRPDYSLGFVRQTPPDGYPAYGGKGRYKQTVDLSYRGLRGIGQIDYLAASARSKQFFFMPDSALGVTDTFFIRPVDGFPDAYNDSTNLFWLPYSDSMVVAQRPGGHPFHLYHDTATLAGNIILQPKGCTANGTITVGDGLFSSPLFALGTRSFDAQMSHFTLRSPRFHDTVFDATNMNAHVDFDSRHALLAATDTLSATTLPLVRYKALANQVDWNMEAQQFALFDTLSNDTRGLEGLALADRLDRDPQPGVGFVSTDPFRENLHFSSVGAVYRYNDAQLFCPNVFLVHVADAVVAPSGDSLLVRQGGAIDMLHKAQVLANCSNKRHLFYNADVAIQSANKYSAKGLADYVDENQRHQPIAFDKIEAVPDTAATVVNAGQYARLAMHTVAHGFVPDSAHFTLNDALGFAGDVSVVADSAFFFFDGGVRLLHNCLPSDNIALLAYSAFLDPLNIQVAVPQSPTDWRGNPISAAVVADSRNLKPRSAFLSNDRPDANALLNAWGVLNYDSKDHVYRIASPDKIDDPDNVVDRVLSLNTQTCVLDGEGPLFLPVRHENQFTFGTVHLNPNDDDDLAFSSLLGLDFGLAPDLLDNMAQAVANDLSVSASDPDNEILHRALIFYLGSDKGEETYMDYVSTGAFDKLPKEFVHDILIGKVNWSFSPSLGYFFDGVVPLTAVGSHQLHLDVRLKAQAYKFASMACLTLYIQIAPDHWYYLNFESNSRTLTLLSSRPDWNDLVDNLPASKRQVTMPSGSTLRYRLSSDRNEVPKFLLKFSQDSDD